MTKGIIEIIKQNATLDKTVKHVVNDKFFIKWNEKSGEWNLTNCFGFGAFSSLDFDKCLEEAKR